MRYQFPYNHPGIQLLATCKQAYAERYKMYHSTNTFFLPPGPLKNTFDLLSKFHECRRLMIECVGIELDLQDLTPVIF